MIAERTDFEVPYKELERAALAVLDGQHRATAMTWLSELGQHLESVSSRDDLDAVVQWSARLDRLTNNLPESEASTLAKGYLAAILHSLDRRAAVLSQQRDVLERDREAGGVRDRVLAFVIRQPRSRSGEIAEALEIAPSQASRALRELQERGLVFLAEPNGADRDGRVHRYVAARGDRSEQAA